MKYALPYIALFLLLIGTGCGTDEDSSNTKSDTPAWTQFDYISESDEGEVKLFNRIWMGCEFNTSVDEVKAAFDSSEEPESLVAYQWRKQMKPALPTQRPRSISISS